MLDCWSEAMVDSCRHEEEKSYSSREVLSITDGERAEDSGMNTRLTYIVKHIQKGLTLLGKSVLL